MEFTYYLGIKCTSSELPDANELLYSGEENDRVMVQKFKIGYPCLMDILYFPFDTQRCKFKLKLETKGSQSIILKANTTEKVVSYDGPFLMQKFRLLDIR